MSKPIYCLLAFILVLSILSSAAVIDQATIKEIERGNIILIDSQNNTIAEINYSVPKTIFTNEENSINAAVQVQDPPFDRIQLLTYLIVTGTESVEHNITCEENLICGLERGNIAIRHDEPGLYYYYFVTALMFGQNNSIADITNDDETIIVKQEGEDFIIVKNITLKAIARSENVGAVNYIQRTEDARSAIAKIMEETNPIALQTYLDRSKIANKSLLIEKPAPVFKDGKSVYTIRIKPRKNQKAEQVMVYESIPKTVAANISELSFEGRNLEQYQAYIKEKYPNAYLEVIKPDPLMVWHFEAVEEEIDLQYEVGKEVDSRETGSTLVTAEKSSSTLWWQRCWYAIAEKLSPILKWGQRYWFAILIIVVVVPTVIYFSRFQKTKKTEVDISVEVDEDKKDTEHIEVDADKKVYSGARIKDEQIVKLEFYIKERLHKGHRKEDIKNDILKGNWPEHIVEQIFRKLK